MASPQELLPLDSTEKRVVKYLATTLKSGRMTLEANELSEFLDSEDAGQRLVSIVAHLEELGFLTDCATQPAPQLKVPATREKPQTYSLIQYQRNRFIGWKIDGSVIGAERLFGELKGSTTANADEPKRISMAYHSFESAQSKNDQTLTDREAYEWLEENGRPEYELPCFETWHRYVREGRKNRGTQKHSRRAGRTGRSIVSPDHR